MNNSEDDICRMLNDAFHSLGKSDAELFPPEIADEHTELSAFIHDKINNSVYQACFASKQRRYEIACRKVLSALDKMEKRLATRRYLFGQRTVEPTGDSAYHGHFKCNVHRIVDYVNLRGCLIDLCQLPRMAETVNFSQIKRHYYMTHEQINPTRIVPLGPALDLNGLHGHDLI